MTILRFLEGPWSPRTKASVAMGIVSKRLRRAVCASQF